MHGHILQQNRGRKFQKEVSTVASTFYYRILYTITLIGADNPGGYIFVIEDTLGSEVSCCRTKKNTNLKLVSSCHEIPIKKPKFNWQKLKLKAFVLSCFWL